MLDVIRMIRISPNEDEDEDNDEDEDEDDDDDGTRWRTEYRGYHVFGSIGDVVNQYNRLQHD